MFPRILSLTFALALFSLLLGAPILHAQQKSSGKTPPPPDPAKLDKYLDGWEKAMGAIDTMQITCDRIETQIALRDTDVFSGTIIFKKIHDKKTGDSYRARMDTVKKGGKAEDYEKVVFTGNYIYKFSPHTKEIEYFAMPAPKPGQAQENFLPFLSGMKAADAKKRYDMKLSREDDHYLYVDVVPLFAKDKVDFKKAQLVLNKKTLLPRRLWYVEPSKNTVTYEINKIESNITLPANLFFRPELPGKDWKWKQIERAAEDKPAATFRPQKK